MLFRSGFVSFHPNGFEHRQAQLSRASDPRLRALIRASQASLDASRGAVDEGGAVSSCWDTAGSGRLQSSREGWAEPEGPGPSRAGGAGGEGGLGQPGGIQAPVSVPPSSLTQLKTATRQSGPQPAFAAPGADCRPGLQSAAGGLGGSWELPPGRRSAHRRWPQCAGHPERSQQGLRRRPVRSRARLCTRQLRGPIPGPGGPPSARPGLAPLVSG